MSYDWFIIGMFCFLLAQVIRAIRWQLLLPDDITIVKRRLVLSVSLGSLLNTFLPLHIGDIFRALFTSRSENLRFPYTLVSILIERLTDILFLFLIGIISLGIMQQSINIELWLLLAPVIVISIWTGVKWSPYVRKLIFTLSSVWNLSIQCSILDFFWTIVTQINHMRFLSFRFLLLSFIMWSAYVFSYLCFAYAMPDFSLNQSWQLFHGEILYGTLSNVTIHSVSPNITKAFSMFIFTPILAVIGYSIFCYLSQYLAGSKKIVKFLSMSTKMSQHGVPRIFVDDQPYNNFLVSYFSDRKDPINSLGVIGFDDCKITRVFHGGSGAITAVVENKGKLSIRKVAWSNGKGNALREQYNWLKNTYLKDNFSVVEVMKFTEGNFFSYYEMPYDIGATDMYEWVHAVNSSLAVNTMHSVVNELSEHHQKHMNSKQSPDLLKLYLDDKVVGNIKSIKEIVGRLINIDEFYINGEMFSINEWEYLECSETLMGSFSDTRQTNIHGDLTIDNLIIRSDQKWMAIDSNSVSVYKTPLMDWAKLLQSLHKGYEYFSRNVECTVDQQNINFMPQYSNRYQHLYSEILYELDKRFGEDGKQEAYLHEIIHYLRLLPYKFKISNNNGLLFYAITCILIREYKDKYNAT